MLSYKDSFFSNPGERESLQNDFRNIENWILLVYYHNYLFFSTNLSCCGEVKEIMGAITTLWATHNASLPKYKVKR